MVVVQADVMWIALYVESILHVYTYNSGTVYSQVNRGLLGTVDFFIH